MPITAYLLYDRRHAHQRAAMYAFAEGLRLHGNLAHLATDLGSLGDQHELVITWGDQAAHTGRPRLCLEAGYVNGTSGDYTADRLRFISVGWNGIHGHADDITIREPDRWRELGIEIKPWRSGGHYVLVMEQYPTDSCAPPPAEWARIKQEMRREYGERIKVRPHPLVNGNAEPLADALRNAWLAVTWSSTSAIEAVLSGVPTITLNSGGIARPVSGHGLNEPVFTGSREQWAYNLAYRQFTLAEFENGVAWECIGNATRQASQN